MIYPDTSFLIPLYTIEPHTAEAREYAEAASDYLAFTPFHRLEFRTGLRVRAFQKRIAPSDLRAIFKLCDEHLAEGALQHTPLNWTDALREAERIGEAHLLEIGARSGDLLHVASAIVLGAKEFLTFGQRQHALARRAGLKVKTWRK